MKAIFLSFFLVAIMCTYAQETKKEVIPVVTTFTKGSITVNDSNILKIFQQRRSVRNYKPDAIPEADILKIIDAARMAPTSGNQQPWKFLIIQDKNTINQLKEACISRSMNRYDSIERQKRKDAIQSRFDGYFSAPVYIIVLTDNNSTYPDYNHYDGPLAAGYLMLAARALGYGTVFITDVIPDEITKKVLNIPDHYTRVCITPLGIPFEWPDTPTKKELEEFISFETLK